MTANDEIVDRGDANDGARDADGVVRAFVPGRLCLLGEHSDWAGERARADGPGRVSSSARAKGSRARRSSRRARVAGDSRCAGRRTGRRIRARRATRAGSRERRERGWTVVVRRGDAVGVRAGDSRDV